MVQGSPAVRWTPENNHKLLQALVIIHAGTPDYKKIASVFGPNVPVDAISYRIRALRKEGAALGISNDNSPPPAKLSQFKRTAISNGKHNQNGRKRNGLMGEDTDDDEGMNTDDALAQQLGTPSKSSKKAQKVISGRVTKARKSPRAATKKDYKALGDPFIGTTFLNSDGEKVFPTDDSDGEDSIASDKGYSGEDEDGVKIEEAV